MEQWQCTVQTSELLCQIQKFDLESSSRKGSQHVTFIWSAGQNYWTNCSDGRTCQSAQRDETPQTPKSQKGVIILYACFHWDKPNRSLSGMAFMRINLENEEAGGAYLNRNSCFFSIIHIFQSKLKAFCFQSPPPFPGESHNCIRLQLMNMSDVNKLSPEKWVCCECPEPLGKKQNKIKNNVLEISGYDVL